jgi:hypothetical protein
VTAWQLQQDLGHAAMTETMRYVHFARNHRRPIPPHVLEAARGETDPDRRVVRMLGARGSVALVDLGGGQEPPRPMAVAPSWPREGERGLP